MLQHKTWMFNVRLKGTLFMGKKIPVRFPKLLPCKLYFFAIHQTPCSLCIRRLFIYSVHSRYVLQTAGGKGWNTGYQWLSQRHSADILCSPVLSHAVKYAQASSWYLLMRNTAQMLSLLETPAHTQDAVTLSATTNVLEMGKRYVQILCINGGFSAHWDRSSHFHLTFFLLHICLSTRRKLLELLLERNK